MIRDTLEFYYMVFALNLKLIFFPQLWLSVNERGRSCVGPSNGESFLPLEVFLARPPKCELADEELLISEGAKHIALRPQF